MKNLNIVNLIEGFHLLQAMNFLYEKNLLQILKKPVKIECLAKDFDFDLYKLNALLWYLASRTDIIISNKKDTYQLNEAYFSYRKSGFMIEQYFGAYNFDSTIIEKSLKSSSSKTNFVNEEKHALAYGKLEDAGFPFLKNLISQMEAECILEFGCGTGNLLCDLAKENPGFIGYGVDANPEMCFKFQKNIEEYQLSEQLTVIEGDAEKPNGIIHKSIAQQVDLVVAASLVNSFFASGEEKIVNWLKELKILFPHKQLLLVDYYGRIGTKGLAFSPEVLLHDWVQIISNQGIPPEDTEAWQIIYEKANCRLLDTMQPKKSVIPFFIHLVSL